jgi:hypothetical protein
VCFRQIAVKLAEEPPQDLATLSKGNGNKVKTYHRIVWWSIFCDKNSKQPVLSLLVILDQLPLKSIHEFFCDTVFDAIRLIVDLKG